MLEPIENRQKTKQGVKNRQETNHKRLEILGIKGNNGTKREWSLDVLAINFLLQRKFKDYIAYRRKRKNRMHSDVSAEKFPTI